MCAKMPPRASDKGLMMTTATNHDRRVSSLAGSGVVVCLVAALQFGVAASMTTIAPTLTEPQPAAPVAMMDASELTADAGGMDAVGLAELLVDSIILVESGGDPHAVGSHGERGLMQIRSGTWTDTTRSLFGSALPYRQAFDPALNRRVGKAYLAVLQNHLLASREQWQADERSLLLACYNAGPGRVAEANYRLDRLPASTRDYIRRVSALHDEFVASRYPDRRPSFLLSSTPTGQRDT